MRDPSSAPPAAPPLRPAPPPGGSGCASHSVRLNSRTSIFGLGTDESRYIHRARRPCVHDRHIGSSRMISTDRCNDSIYARARGRRVRPAHVQLPAVSARDRVATYTRITPAPATLRARILHRSGLILVDNPPPRDVHPARRSRPLLRPYSLSSSHRHHSSLLSSLSLASSIGEDLAAGTRILRHAPDLHRSYNHTAHHHIRQTRRQCSAISISGSHAPCITSLALTSVGVAARSQFGASRAHTHPITPSA